MAAILALPLSAIKAYEAYLVKYIFDKGFSPQSTSEESHKLAFLLVGLGILNFPLRYYHYYVLRQVVDKSTRLIRSKIYKKFQMSHFLKIKLFHPQDYYPL